MLVTLVPDFAGYMKTTNNTITSDSIIEIQRGLSMSFPKKPAKTLSLIDFSDPKTSIGIFNLYTTATKETHYNTKFNARKIDSASALPTFVFSVFMTAASSAGDTAPVII